MPRGTRTPSLAHPPIRVHQFSEAAYRSGIEEHRLDDVPIKVYNPEKALANCFKFRNKIGMDVVLEALRLYRTRKRFDVGKLLHYARICRVERIMRPYLEGAL
jgi:hypothetical protein